MRLPPSPSFGNGFARSAGESAYPELWRGLVGLFAPRLGHQGATMMDFSPLRNHGTLTNMENTDDWSPTAEGFALNFGGTNEYTTSPSHASYALTSTISVFADVTFTSSAVDQGIVYRGSNAAFGVAGNRWYMYCDGSSIFFLGSKVGASTFTSAGASGLTATTNTRYRVASTFDNGRATKWRFYINGVEYAQTTPTDNGAFASDANALEIGRLGSLGTFQYMTGPLRELAIYNIAVPDYWAMAWSRSGNVTPFARKQRSAYRSPVAPPTVNRRRRVII